MNKPLAVVPIPALSDNYIWLLSDGRTAACVDPGEAAPVLDFLNAHGLALTTTATTPAESPNSNAASPNAPSMAAATSPQPTWRQGRAG